MPSAPRKGPIFRGALNQELMDEMMARCSVDLLAVIGKDGGQSYVEARAKCRACSCAGTCRNWLLTPDGELSSEPQDFCPNAPLFRGLLSE